MRRLVTHAIAGIGFAAVVTTAAVASLSSPVATGSAAAGAPVVSVAQSAASSSATGQSVSLEQAAERAEAKSSRGLERLELSAAAQKAAAARAAQLRMDSRLIAAQQDKLDIAAAQAAAAKVKAKAEAKAKAIQAAKAKTALIKKQGYLPGTSDPRSIAKQILKNKYGYGADQYSCFNNIIMRESMWVINATNRSSGAYGIPQALPGTKMATIASDWRTNPATQIIWGIEYMKSRYGSPCGAWGFKSSHGWY